MPRAALTSRYGASDDALHHHVTFVQHRARIEAVASLTYVEQGRPLFVQIRANDPRL